MSIQSEALAAAQAKYASKQATSKGKTCNDYLADEKRKRERAREIRERNKPLAIAARKKADEARDEAMKKLNHETEKEAKAIGASLTCPVPRRVMKAVAAKPAKRKARKAAAPAAPKPAKKAAKKARKKAAKKATAKKAAKKTGGRRSPIVQIDGVEYDRKMFSSAKRSGKRGQISIKEAHRLLKHIEDGRKYTDIEKTTMAYIRDHYRFTPEADEWLRHQIASDAAVKAAKTRQKKASKRKAAKKASAKKSAKRGGKKRGKKASAKKASKKQGKRKAAKKGGKKAGKRGGRRTRSPTELSVELATGTTYDDQMLRAANRALKGTSAENPHITIAGAMKILRHIKDGHKYDDLEKRTMSHIRDTYKFTPEADEWLRHQIASDAAVKAAKTRKKIERKKQAKKAAKSGNGRRGPRKASGGLTAVEQAIMDKLSFGEPEVAANQPLPRRGRRPITEACPNPSGGY